MPAPYANTTDDVERMIRGRVPVVRKLLVLLGQKMSVVDDGVGASDRLDHVGPELLQLLAIFC